MSRPISINLIKLFKPIIISGTILLATGCSSQGAFGEKANDYTNAKELPPVKFPSGSLAVSSRYDIPAIPGNNKPLIKDILPPDF